MCVLLLKNSSTVRSQMCCVWQFWTNKRWTWLPRWLLGRRTHTTVKDLHYPDPASCRAQHRPEAPTVGEVVWMQEWDAEKAFMGTSKFHTFSDGETTWFSWGPKALKFMALTFWLEKIWSRGCLESWIQPSMEETSRGVFFLLVYCGFFIGGWGGVMNRMED